MKLTLRHRITYELFFFFWGTLLKKNKIASNYIILGLLKMRLDHPEETPKLHSKYRLN